MKTWSELLGDYQGNEIISGDMISRPINEWGCIDSNNRHYKVIYRAENNSQAQSILESWKNEKIGTNS